MRASVEEQEKSLAFGQIMIERGLDRRESVASIAGKLSIRRWPSIILRGPRLPEAACRRGSSASTLHQRTQRRVRIRVAPAAPVDSSNQPTAVNALATQAEAPEVRHSPS